mgnify:CR=1 FL=1
MLVNNIIYIISAVVGILLILEAIIYLVVNEYWFENELIYHFLRDKEDWDKFSNKDKIYCQSGLYLICFCVICMILDNVWLNCLFLLPITLFFIISKIIKYINLTKQYNIYRKQYNKPLISKVIKSTIIKIYKRII